MKNKSKYFSLTNDYVFKRIFGRVGNEEITTNLLESVFNYKIKNIDLDKNTFLERDFDSDKIGILDIRAVLNDSIPCNIEVQVIPFDYLSKRILYYWAKLYASSIKKGESFRNLKKTIVVWIIDFEFSEFEPKLAEIQNFHTKWHIHEDDFHKYILSDVLEIHIISLKLLEKSIELGYNENEKDLINWIKFIKNPNLEGADFMENEYIKRAKNEYDELEEDEHERYLAESRMIHLMDIKSIEESGYEHGKKAGLEEGIKKGTKAGEKKQKIKIAKIMLKNNESIPKIMEYTGLSKEEIEELK